MELSIEVASGEDLEKILNLQRLAYQSEAEKYDDYTIPPLTQTLEGIRDDLESCTFLKAVVGGRIVGSVRARREDDSCYIGRLIVHPDFQDRGIGTRLMLEIESRFEGTGRFELFTGHLSDGNLHLYGKLGYKTVRYETVSDMLKLVYMEKTIVAEGE